jgi:hypothetical protein
MPTNAQENAARQRVIDSLSAELKSLLPQVLTSTGIEKEQSLHAAYGGKYAEYIDIKNEVIHSPEHFVSLYLEGFKKRVEESQWPNAHTRNFQLVKRTPILKRYLFNFLKRTYLRNYSALSKRRTRDEEAAIWIGQNHANYGLLVTPKFSEVRQQWCNDHSEIRHFEHSYWSVGHILRTGLVIPGRDERIPFRSAEEWLNFFVNVLVRNSGSIYETQLALLYREYVLSVPEPLNVPLLIPELRYDGIDANHKYRLDFTAIEATDMNKVAFELSPWSTHGYLAKTKKLSQAEINEMAKDNFEKEMAKHKAFFRK